ncbi:MAG: hypothetical protein M1456_06935 [Actinobacteria bacterium]|nr:hypothetical protein [Actinomycetota bacterium]MCL5885525.1 hypothetical protein [Actinomycetota bacterium]
MKYIYAGYVISLLLFFIYGITLIIRRAKLEKSIKSLDSNKGTFDSSWKHEKVESS